MSKKKDVRHSRSGIDRRIDSTHIKKLTLQKWGDKTKLTTYLSTLKIEISPKQIQQIQNTGPSESWEDS